MFPHLSDEQELLTVVKQCKGKSPSGYDGIYMYVVKKVISRIAKPLMYICNTSFETGIFPDNMKVAKVIPVYKTGEKNSFNNYRHISLLPQFSKILQKLFDNRLEKFMEQNEMLSNSQYGFRKKQIYIFGFIRND